MDKEINKRQTLLFEMRPNSFEDMGDKLLRVSCNLVGVGPNRNGSNITKSAILGANDTLKHLPVVANIIKDNDGTYYVGSHDILIKYEPEISMEELTVPVGCVAGDKEFEFVNIEESSGNFREYLKCDLILWKNMSPIMEAAYNENLYFNQSVEIDDVYGSWDTDDGSFRIDSFVYDKACLLGLCSHDPTNKRHSEPCFRKAQVYPKQYSLNDDFNKQFALLIKEINDFNLASSKDANLNINVKTTQCKEERSLDKNEVFAKIKSLLAQFTFKMENTDRHYDRFIYLSHDDNSVNVIDREDARRVYTIPYCATEVDDGIIVNISYDEKVLKSFVVGDKTDNEFDFNKEIDTVVSDVSIFKVAECQAEEAKKWSAQLDVVKANYENAQNEIARLKNQLTVFENEKNQLIAQKHKETIDALVDSKYDEMKDFSKYSLYRAKIDYDKTVEQVAKDIREIHYEYLSGKKSNNGGKHTFAAIEASLIEEQYDSEYDGIAREYGVDMVRYFRKSKNK